MRKPLTWMAVGAVLPASFGASAWGFNESVDSFTDELKTVSIQNKRKNPIKKMKAGNRIVLRTPSFAAQPGAGVFLCCWPNRGKQLLIK